MNDVDTSIAGESPTQHLDHQIRRLEADLRASKAALAATAERLGEVGRLLDSELVSTRNATERIIQLETQRDSATERERAALTERDAARAELAHVTGQRDRARRFAARLLLESGPHSLATVKLKADLAAAQVEATEWRAKANAPFVLKDTPIEAGAAVAVYPGMTFKLKTTLGPDVAGAAVAVWPPAPNTDVTGGNFDVMPPGSAAELERLRKRVAMDAEFLRTFRAEQRDIIAAQQAEVSLLAAEHAGVLARAQAAVCKGIEEIREAASMHAPTAAQRSIINDAVDELEQSRRYHHAIDELLREFIAGVDPNGRQLALIREKLIELAALHDDLADLSERAAKESTEAERLRLLLNTPEVLDFAKAVNLEAAHQRERWGSDQDAGKTDADWFWLVGFLVGKALHKPEKRLHHLITAAAALANWHLYSLGKTDMRPGIEPPKGPHDRDDCPSGHPLGTDGPCAGCNCADPDPTLPAEGGGGS